jgi:hypothetical protein
LPLLKQLVMASDRATHEFLSWYLSSTLELYHKAQQAVQTKVSDARTAVSGPLDFVRNLLAGRTFPPTLDAAEVAELRQRVLELEARVAELSGSAPAVRADSETRSPRKRASPRRRVRQ